MQTESPERNPTQTRNDQVCLAVTDDVDTVVNATLPWFKRLEPMRAAKAAI